MNRGRIPSVRQEAIRPRIASFRLRAARRPPSPAIEGPDPPPGLGWPCSRAEFVRLPLPATMSPRFPSASSEPTHPGARSLALSVALHGAAAILAVVTPIAWIRGRPTERLTCRIALGPPAPPPLEFEVAREPPTVVEPPPLPPPELVPVPLPPEENREPPEPDPTERRFDLGPDPFAHIRPDAFRRRQAEPEPEPPVAALHQPPAPPPADPAPPGVETSTSAPVLIPERSPKPEYPRRAVRLGLEGAVVLRIEVLADGTVGEVEFQRSSGHRLLDQAAVRGVKGWHFVPATRDGRPISTWVRKRILFRIENGP